MKRFITNVAQSVAKSISQRFFHGQGVSLSVAQSILGLENVFPADDVKIVVPYAKTTLKKVAKENAEGKGIWKLVYKLGLPIAKIHKVHLPEFLFMPVWEKKNIKAHVWMNEQHEAGYRLVNFQLKPMSHFTLEVLKSERVHKAKTGTVLEALVAIKKATGVRMLEGECHAEDFLDGGRLLVGYYNRDGIQAYMYSTEDLSRLGPPAEGVERAWCVSCIAPIDL